MPNPKAKTAARSTGRPKNSEVQARQAHLLEVAGAAFIELGYAGASLEQIAQRARVGKQTIYSRFDNKAGLFRAVASYMLHAPLLASDDQPADMEFEGGLRQRVAAVLHAAVEPSYAALFRLFLREAASFPDVFDALRQVREKHIEKPLVSFITSHIATGRATTLPVSTAVELLMAMLNSFISVAALRNELIPAERIEAEADAIVHLFLHGLFAPEKGQAPPA